MQRFLAQVFTLALLAVPAAAQSVPASGTDVLKRMHDMYAGKWYTTLEFSQKTTIYMRDGNKREEIWRERLWQSPTRGTLLRIDQGDSTARNYSINLADSLYSVQGGVARPVSTNGNPFLPLIEGVYVQPIDKTVRDLRGVGADLSKVSGGTWQGKPVWIVGAATVADSMLPQFWVDPATMLVVRMLVSFAPGRPPLDIHLDSYVKAGGGWLATKVTMFANGAPRQVEEYYDWKTGIKLDASLFEAPKPAN